MLATCAAAAVCIYWSISDAFSGLILRAANLVFSAVLFVIKDKYDSSLLSKEPSPTLSSPSFSALSSMMGESMGMPNNHD